MAQKEPRRASDLSNAPVHRSANPDVTEPARLGILWRRAQVVSTGQASR